MSANCAQTEPAGGCGIADRHRAGSSPCPRCGLRIGNLTRGTPTPHGRAGRPPQFDEVVDGAHQVELALDPVRAPKRKAAKAAALDLAEDGFHRNLPLGIDRVAALGPQPPAHPVGGAERLRDAPPPPPTPPPPP